MFVNMKKISVLVCTQLFVSLFASEGFSPSLLLPRSVVNNASYDPYALVYSMYTQDWKGYINFTLFMQHSYDSESLADYFYFNDQKKIILDELYTDTTPRLRDINPVHLGLMPLTIDDPDYRSEITFAPFRKSFGCMLDMRYYFSDAVWAQIKLGAMQVTTNMQLQEKKLSTSTGGGVPGIDNANEAFMNQEWTAGKIQTRPVHKTGFDDVLLKMGYDFFQYEESPHRGGLYIFTVLPSGISEQQEYLFHPSIGDRNIYFGLGVSGDFCSSIGNEGAITLSGDLRGQCGLDSFQYRTFDLTENGSWSRYMLMSYESNPLDVQYGINVTTALARVKQFGQVQGTFVLSYDRPEIGAKIGYNVWYKSAEKIVSIEALNNVYAVADLPHISGNLIGLAISASTANISQSVIPGIANNGSIIPDAVFTPFTPDDFDRSSAQNPQACTSTVWAGIQMNKEINDAELRLSVNGSYEFVHKFGSIPTWSVWGIIGLEF
ncbi:hypothetical protein EBQ93_04230 [bacterium]|nr:hypothetical protein [bacterium]